MAETKQKKTADIKLYMKEYREKNKVKCACGGSFNPHTAEKHGNSSKHQAYLAKEKEKLIINEEETLQWLKERFQETNTTNENSKQKRTDKNTPIFRKLFEAAETKSYDFMLEHRLELVKKAYGTPSSQQSALSTLKLVLDHVKPLTDDLKKSIYKEGIALAKEYKETAALKEDGMTYEQLKEHETSEDPTLAMFSHLYAADMPALRLSQWVNSSVGKNGKMNELILSTGKYTARVTKTNAPEHTFKLPERFTKWLKKQKFNGPLFGDLTTEDVTKKITKALGEGNGSRYWRKKYVSEVVSKMTGEERIRVAKEMGHSLQTQVEVYQKDKPKKSSSKV
jgi:hypothetical protein